MVKGSRSRRSWEPSRKSKTCKWPWETASRTKMKRKRNTLVDEVSRWEKTRQKEKDKKRGNKRGRGKECEECTQIQRTRQHNHGNRTLHFNPSCSGYHRHLSIRDPASARPHSSPSSGLSFSHLTWPPEIAAIMRLFGAFSTTTVSTFTFSLKTCREGGLQFTFWFQRWHTLVDDNQENMMEELKLFSQNTL